MATEFLDKQFIKEFNTVCKHLKSIRPFNIRDIDIPRHLVPEPENKSTLYIPLVI